MHGKGLCSWATVDLDLELKQKLKHRNTVYRSHAVDIALAFWTVRQLPCLQSGLLWLRQMILVCAKEAVRRMTDGELE